MPVLDGWAHLPENERARLWRLGAGLCQREVAAITGHTLREVRAVEAGRADAAAMKAYRMAVGFYLAGVVFDWGPVLIEPAPGLTVQVLVPNRAKVAARTQRSPT